MKVLNYLASLLCLYLIVQAWVFLWNIHFLLPIGILMAVLAIVMVILATAEDRKKARSDRIFEAMCDQYDRQERSKGESCE